MRVVQRILGHRSLASTEAYLKSLTDREVWTASRTAAAYVGGSPMVVVLVVLVFG